MICKKERNIFSENKFYIENLGPIDQIPIIQEIINMKL